MSQRRVAVIGTGVAGLVAAHVLRRSCTVTVYEADDRPGGHAHTHDVRLRDGTGVGVDSGFIVHNDRTYPTLQRLFRELDIPTQKSDMSMSVCGVPGWEYAGGKGVSGLLADPHTVANGRYRRMLRQVPAFHRAAVSFLEGSEPDDLLTVGDWLTAHGFTADLREHFVRPIISAVWSCDPPAALEYPARSLFTFLRHHGMLSVKGSPTWRTVTGGSRTYVDRVLAPIADLRLGTAVVRLERTATGVRVHDSTGASLHVDAAVVATHPHQALAMQPDADVVTKELLSALEYSRNDAVLHTDQSLLPEHRRARASWNYRVGHHGQGVLITYDLTRLQRLPSPQGQRVLVTLNGGEHVRPGRVLERMTYEHPLYTSAALKARRRLPGLSDSTLAYAGAYHGWGFHEDGALSGLRAAQRLGGRWT